MIDSPPALSPDRSASAAGDALSAVAPLHLLLGRRDAKRMREIRSTIEAHALLQGRAHQWHVPAKPQETPAVADAAAQQAQRDGGVLVAVGGDGTINAAARACWPLGVPMAVLGQGTFNYFIREHGLADELEPALDQLGSALREHSVKAVWPGLVNGRLFLVNASLGLYPRLLAEREQATRRFGRHQLVAMTAGLLSMLRAQSGQLLRLQDCDGAEGVLRERTQLISTLFIGNNALQLERVGVPEAEQAGQRRLVATALAPRPALQMIRLLWRAARGRLGDDEAVQTFDFDCLQVESAGRRKLNRVRLAFDGERDWTTLPLTFEVGERPLWLVAPAAADDFSGDAH